MVDKKLNWIDHIAHVKPKIDHIAHLKLKIDHIAHVKLKIDNIAHLKLKIAQGLCIINKSKPFIEKMPQELILLFYIPICHLLGVIV